MCWNENVSLNTFMFSSVVLVFILYNNFYTQYKLEDFKSGLLYFLILSGTTMQLIEYYLWKSINKKDIKLNTLFSIAGWILIRILQPLMLILIIPDTYSIVRNFSFIIYFTALFIISILKQYYNPIQFITTVDKSGHLYWNWGDLYGYETIIYALYIILFLTLFLSYPVIAFILLLSMLYSYYKYNLNWSSMWCWYSNTLSLLFLVKILFILPYKEYNQVC